MKIIIAGGRYYEPCIAHNNAIWKLKNDGIIFDEIVSGCCTGADEYGKYIAELMGIPVKKFPPDWVKYGKKAGPVRNEQMAKYADGCILLPGGKGTADMKAKAIKYNLKIWEIK